ncbi:MAG: hypothetical protein V3V04_04785 [Rhizobiaceae bacterium]
MNLLKICLGALSTIVATVAYGAESESISTVRKAAIDRMQSRLGSIRGSIKPNEEHIFLTEGMINNLKPIRESRALNTVAVEEGGKDKIKKSGLDANGKTTRELAEDIYRSVGLKNIDRSSITHSIAGHLPETSDMDILEKAVERMVSENQ